jgi:hypothetical protein
MLFPGEGDTMHPRRSSGRARRLARARIGRSLWLAVLVTAAAAGCGNSGAAGQGPATRARVTACGTAKTAAAVPVKIEVITGQLACTTARAVERAYAAAIRSGQAPGNGGGGPVKIRGWTCQGFATPIVLQTGKASKCVRDGVEILEILPPVPSPSTSP